jgi:nicotinate-nucleotide adenylyltransferase
MNSPVLPRAIGIFGGTFDPIHFGHLDAAEEVRCRLELEDMRMLPAGDPPHREAVYASAGQRLAMLELALRDYPGLAVDRRELDRQGPSYMVDTLAELRQSYPDRPLLLVIGQDAANALDRWHRWRAIPELAHLVVVSRPGQEAGGSPQLAAEFNDRWVHGHRELLDTVAGRALRLNARSRDISSSAIRRRLREGRTSLEDWLPGPVLNHIEAHGLYR